MALNEHDTNGPSAPAAPTTDHEYEHAAAMLAAQIVKDAEAALQANDPEGYARALAQVDGIDHRHRSHQARLRTAEIVFATREHAPPHVVARCLFAALSALTSWLEHNPREPSLLGYAGVLGVELGIYREAQELLEAAARLNPQLPDIDKTLRVVRQRRKAKATVPGLPGDVRAQLPKLRPRLAKVAASAKPAEGLTLSLCMIVRDEEEMLPRCLEAIKDGVDEMVIVDTGSRDRTVEIAESYGAKVLHHTWTGNFGEARNIGMDAATGDWLIVIDADEVFVGDDAKRLHELKGHTWREAFFIEEINHTGDLDDGTAAKHNALRMIRNKPEHRYIGTVHEQLAHHLPGYLPERLEHTDIRMEHFGYLGSVREEKGKTDRNMQLLLDQLEEEPESAFVQFNVASEYSGVVGAEEKAMEHFERAWELIVDDENFRLYGFVPSLVTRYVRSLRIFERFEEMDAACKIIHERFENFTDVYFEQALGKLDSGERDEGVALLEKCLEIGDAPALYSATVGAGTFLPEMRMAQVELSENRVADALARMKRIRQGYPSFLGLIDTYVTVLLIDGTKPDDVVSEITDGVELSPSGWFLLAINLQERGHLVQAEAAFRGALERRPTLDVARVALADALLVQERVEEAAQEAEKVPADVFVGGAGVRTALFARLVLTEGDRLQEQRDVLVEQLPSTNLSEADQAVLRAWNDHRARRATGERPELGIDAVNALTPMLDATLRLGAGDAFADLVAVLEETGIERRSQHEVLALTLLRRGLPDMAADEWVTAIQEDGPDASAFAGLAEVARVQGMLDDARTLASEALTLEPEHALAARVLAAVGD
ncbi:MAG: glycosyltransferase [Solirubrobacteraceae bacterium]|nr:glycosyltransferase [Solirubrobacteraceae bacterium]